MSFKRKGSRRGAYNPNKMDTTRAQGILGFSSNRWMDTTAGSDPKKNLDKALDDQMQKLTLRKAAKNATKDKVWSNNYHSNNLNYEARLFAHNLIRRPNQALPIVKYYCYKQYQIKELIKKLFAALWSL